MDPVDQLIRTRLAWKTPKKLPKNYLARYSGPQWWIPALHMSQTGWWRLWSWHQSVCVGIMSSWTIDEWFPIILSSQECTTPTLMLKTATQSSGFSTDDDSCSRAPVALWMGVVSQRQWMLENLLDNSPRGNTSLRQLLRCSCKKGCRGQCKCLKAALQCGRCTHD